jgi:hypothetical protein
VTTHIKVRNRTALLAVVLGAVVAAVLPVSAAVAFDSSPQTWQVIVGTAATLEAKGVAVSVPVEVTCPAGAFSPRLDLTVIQRSGSGTVSGSRSTELSCTGAPQQLTVAVIAQDSSKLFKKGSAFADASVSGCDFITCGVRDTDSRTISIGR